jgi:hypothetical protein
MSTNANNTDFTMDLASMQTWYNLIVTLSATVIADTPLTRNPSIARQKLRWQDYVDKFVDHPTFIRRHLRMPLSSFYKLLSYIKEGLSVNNTKANNGGGVILPEICLFCTLRWLAGGSYLDIFALTGVSIPSFYRVVYLTLRLIIECPKLDIKLPQTKKECEAAAARFRSISYKEAITNCIGVIDGYLLRIYTPPKAQTGNVKSYYSGHYSCYGINIEAVCDHHSRFIFFAIAAPGSAKETGLMKALAPLPKLFVIIGDAGYEPSERIIPLFYG